MMELTNPISQVDRLGEIRKSLTEVVNAMENFSAFDEESSVLNALKVKLMTVELDMRKKIREFNRI
jgi:hypothetical protein